VKVLYDLSKKYYHGADGGSTLGLVALNPDEMVYFDEQICSIHNCIIGHRSQCNPMLFQLNCKSNAMDYESL